MSDERKQVQDRVNENILCYNSNIEWKLCELELYHSLFSQTPPLKKSSKRRSIIPRVQP